VKNWKTWAAILISAVNLLVVLALLLLHRG
jgi:hypothetical protein